MPSRLRVFSFVCIFAVLFSMQLVAQSNSASSPAQGDRVFKRATQLSNGLLTPTFGSVTAYSSDGNGANAVAVADLSGNGQADMVVTNWCSDGNCTGGSVVVLTQSNGVFTPTPYPSGGLYADSIVVADVNGDGFPDLVVANCGTNNNTNCVSTSNSGNVGVLINNGDGTFKPVVSYTTGGGGFGVTSVAVADLGNGHLDLIVAGDCSGGGCVGVLLGNGDGTFQAELSSNYSGGLSALSVAVADVNGDGKPDAVVANQCGTDTCTSSTVGVLLGNGDGTFQAATSPDSGGLFADWIAIADVNRDGKPDVIVANSSTSSTDDLGNVAVLLGNGNGTFQNAVSYPSGAYGAASVAVADVNGDGLLDLVVANCSSTASSCSPAGGNVGVLLGNGNGTFQTATTYPAGGHTPFAVTVGDVNGDGRPDLVVGSCASNACGAAPGTLGVLINTTTPWLVYASLARQVDYFGEGTSDFTTWRPSTGTFFSEDGLGHTLIKPWGENGDIPVIGDYDGDGKTDVAVFRPSNGGWYIIPSSTGKAYGVQFGIQGDVPVEGDYDGDGKTDIAVFRPSKGTWYIIPSSTGKAYGVQFGTQGDVPVPGDYDGDGKTDIAVWRPSNQIWYILLSSTGKVVTYKWGLPTDKPVPADYDGDGKTDIAMWRPAAQATWFIVPSSTKLPYAVQFGTTGDVPVPRDYDGDLKADVAVWRPSNQFWYVLQSSNDRVTTTHFGLSTDIPLNKPVGQ